MRANDSQGTLVGSLDADDFSQYGVDQQLRGSLPDPTTPARQYSPRCGTALRDAGSIELRVDYFVSEDDDCALRHGNYTGVWAGDSGASIPLTRSHYFADHVHQSVYYYLPDKS